jgi:hypothetical protein
LDEVALDHGRYVLVVGLGSVGFGGGFAELGGPGGSHEGLLRGGRNGGGGPSRGGLQARGPTRGGCFKPCEFLPELGVLRLQVVILPLQVVVLLLELLECVDCGHVCCLTVAEGEGSGKE